MAYTLSPLLPSFILALQLTQQRCAWCTDKAAVSLICGLGTHCWDAATFATAVNAGGDVAAAATIPPSHVLRSTGSVTDESSLLHISTEVVRVPEKFQANVSLHPPPLVDNRSNDTGRGLIRELEDTGLVPEKAVTKVGTWWRKFVQVLRDVDEEPSKTAPGKMGSYRRHNGTIPDDLVWRRVIRTNRISAWDVAHHVKKQFNLGYLSFFASAGFIDWACFLGALVFFCRLHMSLLALPATRGSHSMALLVWMMAGGFYNLIIWTRLGMDAARSWLTGYWLEFIFSMENVFIFHVVASGFRMSWAHSQKALIIVICFQICFQMVFYMGLAELLISIWALPYLLGAWLVYVGLSTLKEEGDNHHPKDVKTESPQTSPRSRAVTTDSTCDPVALSAQEPPVRRTLTSPADLGGDVSVAPFLSGYVRCFKTVLGDRFKCGYGHGTPSFLSFNGVTRATLLLPALVSLLAVDFIMEIDVTLTKIMEIQQAFIAFTSSVAAAFAVPELFFVAQELLAEFRLLKYGVSFVLVFFGTLLLLNRVVNLNDMVCIVIIMAVMVLCAVLSWLIPPPPIEQETDGVGSIQKATPEDCGVDGCPEVTPQSDHSDSEATREGGGQ